MDDAVSSVSRLSRWLTYLKEKQAKRRRLLAQQFGLRDGSKLRSILGPSLLNRDDEYSRLHRLVHPPLPFWLIRRNVALAAAGRLKPPRRIEPNSSATAPLTNNKLGGRPSRALLTSRGGSANSRGRNCAAGDVMRMSGTARAVKQDVEELTEEIAYTDSTTFLKGTQSDNPHNDYCQHFVDTGERPQNFIRDTGLANRFEEYPKLRELIRLKDEIIMQTATPPMYLKCDLREFDLSDLNCKFDVILVDPPLSEYIQSRGALIPNCWSWDEIEQLEIDQISAQRSFIWIWCGAGEGLDRARRCLRKWGYRRCEDICWIKTNRKGPGHKNIFGNALLQRTKEHLLMGIKGTVRRSTDGDFIHANVDIDLIIEEEPAWGSRSQPLETFHIIEHFCLGRRRLHLFGRDDSLRAGWLTVGPEISASNFDARIYSSYFTKDPQQGNLTGSTDEIERLRPKSPPPRNKGAGPLTETDGTDAAAASSTTSAAISGLSGMGSGGVVGGSGSAISRGRGKGRRGAGAMDWNR